MADENPEPQPVPAPVVVPRGPAPIVSVRWTSPTLAADFNKVLEFRKKKGKSKSASDLIEQMFSYLKKNPWGDFPTGQ